MATKRLYRDCTKGQLWLEETRVYRANKRNVRVRKFFSTLLYDSSEVYHLKNLKVVHHNNKEENKYTI